VAANVFARLPWVLPLLDKAQKEKPRELSADEKRELAKATEEAAAQAKLHQLLQAEAREYAKQIIRTASRYGVKKDLRDEQGRFRRELRLYQPYVVSEEAIKFKVVTDDLPDGISLTDLRDADLLDLLSFNCERMVTFRHHHRRGFWYVVERKEGYGSVPAHVNYFDMLEGKPANTGTFAVPIGKSENRIAHWLNLPSAPHLLVAGSTNMGKSNMEHVWLCTLISQNTPEHCQIWMIDLKGGVELKEYHSLPHIGRVPFMVIERAGELPRNSRRRRALEATASAPPVFEDLSSKPEAEAEIDPDKLDDIRSEYSVVYQSQPRPAIVTSRKFVLGLLYAAEVEAERRMEKISKVKGARNISDYNRRHPSAPMPRIFIVADELASLMRDPQFGGEAEFLIEDLANRARAVGIHLLFFTQTPEANILTPSIRNAFPVKVIFGMANQHMSRSIIGNDSAHHITAQGRAIYMRGSRTIELQTPYMPPDLTLEILDAAMAGTKPERRAKHDIYPDEIYVWAMREKKGHLVAEHIYAQFKHRGLTQIDATEFVRNAIGQRVVVDEQECIIQPPFGHFPKRVPARIMPFREAASQ
jgi:hypothetical protein